MFKNRTLTKDFKEIKSKIERFYRNDIYDVPSIAIELNDEEISSTYTYNGKNKEVDIKHDLKLLETYVENILK